MEETALAATAAPSALDAFHPAVRAWFERTFGDPSECQAAGWPAIQAGPGKSPEGHAVSLK